MIVQAELEINQPQPATLYHSGGATFQSDLKSDAEDET